MNELGQKIIDEAKALGFDAAALVRADCGTPRAEEWQKAHAEGRFKSLDYLERSLYDRTHLGERYAGAKSVLVVLTNYFTGHHEEFAPQKEGDTKISRYAWGRDYHKPMRKALRKLRKRVMRVGIEAGFENTTAACFNDIDPVLDRAWAEASGLGFIGKSGMFISREFGTYTFIGGIITSLETNAPKPVEPQHRCGTCTKCIDACPTKAITSPGVVSLERCLTMWNIERPDDAPSDDELLGHGWSVGCDICQEVCPYNRFSTRTQNPDYQPKDGRVYLHKDDVFDDESLKGTPLARPKAEGIQKSVRRALKLV